MFHSLSFSNILSNIPNIQWWNRSKTCQKERGLLSKQWVESIKALKSTWRVRNMANFPATIALSLRRYNGVGVKCVATMGRQWPPFHAWKKAVVNSRIPVMRVRVQVGREKAGVQGLETKRTRCNSQGDWFGAVQKHRGFVSITRTHRIGRIYAEYGRVVSLDAHPSSSARHWLLEWIFHRFLKAFRRV